jgi:hypothetical protein
VPALRLGVEPPLRVLVAAQSNAAIDELLERLTAPGGGLWSTGGGRVVPALVRLRGCNWNFSWCMPCCGMRLLEIYISKEEGAGECIVHTSTWHMPGLAGRQPISISIHCNGDNLQLNGMPMHLHVAGCSCCVELAPAVLLFR